MTFAASQTERVIDELGPRLASIRPSERQLAWQQMEFYAFVHFGMNTMTGREWGLGHEDPVLFDPSDLDVDGWLTELLSDYGQVFSVWFDGANGEGANGKHQVYDWDRYSRVIRKLQPDAVISVCGPDVRWCGNEAGQTRSDEWSVVPAGLRDVERIADDSQHEDDGEFARLVRSDEDDLDSRSALRGHLDDLVWYPAEVNSSIRPGWFYHREEDDQVRSAEELMGIWYSSVGGNACFLLNVPPNASGRTSEPEADVLDELGVLIADYSARRVSTTVTVSSGVVPEGFGSAADAPGIPWEPTADDARPTVVLHFERPMAIEAIEVREDIRTGQRIEDLVVVGKNGDEAFSLGSVHAVGHRRILRFEPRILDAARLEIRLSRAVPRLLAVTSVAAR